MNRLVPYLDLFMRLDDAELSRLAGVEADLVATLRRQVVEIGEGLAQYLDLLPRLSDEELVRLTGASSKTVRFWRLCQPRTSAARAAELAARAEISSITPMPRPAEPSAVPPVEPRPRRTTGVGMQATSAAASQTQPVANWSHEASATNAATMMITPPPHQVPAASWDTSGPSSGTATMVTPIGQTPEAMWGEAENPAEAATLAAGGVQARTAVSAPAVGLDINGEPFPGYEKWQGARAGTPDDDDAFALSELDH